MFDLTLKLIQQEIFHIKLFAIEALHFKNFQEDMPNLLILVFIFGKHVFRTKKPPKFI